MPPCLWMLWIPNSLPCIMFFFFPPIFKKARLDWQRIMTSVFDIWSLQCRQSISIEMMSERRMETERQIRTKRFGINPLRRKVRGHEVARMSVKKDIQGNQFKGKRASLLCSPNFFKLKTLDWQSYQHWLLSVICHRYMYPTYSRPHSDSYKVEITCESAFY